MIRRIKLRIRLWKIQRALDLRLTEDQRNAALMDCPPLLWLSTWPRRSGKTTAAILWMVFHEKRDEIYFRSEWDRYVDHGEPFFVPDPDIKTLAMFKSVFLYAKEMCEKLQEKGMQAPSLRR